MKLLGKIWRRKPANEFNFLVSVFHPLCPIIIELRDSDAKNALYRAIETSLKRRGLYSEILFVGLREVVENDRTLFKIGSFKRALYD